MEFETSFPKIVGISVAHEFTNLSESGVVYTERRKNYGLNMTVSGEAEFKFSDGKCMTVHSGDVVFLPQGIEYSLKTPNEYRHYTVNFFMEDTAWLKRPMLQHPSNVAYFKSLFSELSKIWTRKSRFYEMAAVGKVYELLAAFVHSADEREKMRHPSYVGIKRAADYIDEHFCEKINVAMLARMADMSETGFRRGFSSMFGITSMEYRDNLRMLKAKDLLQTGFYNVSEVAELCGFDDVSWFCRFFKRRAGMSPGRSI